MMNPQYSYQIRLQEQIDEAWAEWFLPLAVSRDDKGHTLLCGPLRDQSELHGILSKIRDLNLTLLEVQRIEPASSSKSIRPSTT